MVSKIAKMWSNLISFSILICNSNQCPIHEEHERCSLLLIITCDVCYDQEVSRSKQFTP